MAGATPGALPYPFLFNSSFGFFPSPSDLFMVVPRLARHITGVFSDPDDNTTLGWINDTSSAIIESSAPSLNSTTHPAEETDLSRIQTGFSLIGSSFQRLANFDGVFSYLASRWAFSTLVIVSPMVTTWPRLSTLSTVG